jgi:hypothetical protein
MKKALVLLACALIVAGAVPAEAATKKPPTVKLTISNFRYCAADTCTPLDIGYLRPDTAPLAGTDNPLAAVDVKRGSYVSWTYRDAQCDGADGCAGHNVLFENGKPTGKRIGFVPARKGQRSIKTRITQKSGTTIRYYCSVNNHYQTGMTGILNVI